MGNIYRPREDSYLLQKFVEKLVSGKVLDMGTGSGIQAVTAALKSDVTMVVAVDINPNALTYAKKRAIKTGTSAKILFILSDLFECVDGKFDWILFNAPYLPSEDHFDEVSWAGGRTGGEIIRRFLSDVSNYLLPLGTILMVYSSISGLEKRDSNIIDSSC
jgi:release factor glutamine methyltransferase